MNCQVSEEAAVAKIKDRCGGKAGERGTRPVVGGPGGAEAVRCHPVREGARQTWFSRGKGARGQGLGTADPLWRGFGSVSFSISIRNPNFRAKALGKLASREE